MSEHIRRGSFIKMACATHWDKSPQIRKRNFKILIHRARTNYVRNFPAWDLIEDSRAEFNKYKYGNMDQAFYNKCNRAYR